MDELVDWFVENKKDGVTVWTDNQGKTTDQRNLAEVIIQMAAVMPSDIGHLFLAWVKDRFINNIRYTAPEIMAREWGAVHDKLDEMFPHDHAVWDIWSGE